MPRLSPPPVRSVSVALPGPVLFSDTPLVQAMLPATSSSTSVPVLSVAA